MKPTTTTTPLASESFKPVLLLRQFESIPRHMGSSSSGAAEFSSTSIRGLDHHSGSLTPSAGGVPLTIVQDILARPQAEVFITFMARDLNRFLEVPTHMVAAADTVYYLMHGSNHIKAFREMKDATYQVGGWCNSFLEREDLR